MARHVAVIGGGFAGLSAAACLGKAGYRVTLFEKNADIGGRAGVLSRNGFTFDTGPSWYMMPDIFEEFFAVFGKRVSDYYDLVRLDPSYQVFFGDGRMEKVTTTPSVYDLFERVAPGSSAGLEQLLAATKREYDIVRKDLLDRPYLSAREGLTPSAIKLLARSELRGSYHDRIARYVRHPNLQKILEFMTVFMGGSPQNIPGIYGLLTHVDMGLGIWYPMGGFGAVVQAFARLAREQGVEIVCNAPVGRINSTGGQIVSVTVNGADVGCDAVVSTADYQYSETQLADQTYPPAYWQGRTLSPSGLLMFLGVSRKLPNLHHHNLFFDADWDGHFREVFDDKSWSDDPLFYVSVPSKTDDSVAPKGTENVFILAPMANGLRPTQAQMDATADRIIGRIESAIGEQFRDDIVTRETWAHEYFEQTFNASAGNSFGLAHTMRQSVFWRPRMKSKKVAGLYYAGQFTNPGTGVPIVVLSGQIAARLVQKELQ